MAYAQVSDVQNAAPQIDITGSSKPNAQQVQGMVTDVERELDATLGHLGFVVPVDGTESIKILRDMVVYAVIAKVIMARTFGQSDPTAKDTIKAANDYYQCRVKWLADNRNPFDLPDATRTDEAPNKTQSEIVVSEFDNDPDAFPDPPTITRTQTF